MPLNNWESGFGGSAWQWAPAAQQFYYHKFYKQQPDLNWRNPAVEKAMFGSMQFWLDRGLRDFGWMRFQRCLRTRSCVTSRRQAGSMRRAIRT